MVSDDDSLDDIMEKAKIVAEATGRVEAEVLQDLLDDGIVNLSNENPKESLVEQLKEAAELINTVQSINKEVAENTVLNGGENSTEVLVETTLEGDIVDRAIASVHRKAENIKKIALILVPVFLLLTGGTMEGVGMINIFGGDDSENGMGDICNPEWFYDEYGYSFENQIEVRYTFIDYQYCNIEFISGHFIIQLFYEGELIDDTMIANQDFTNEVSVEHTYFNLEPGQYHYRVEFHTVDCEDGSCEHGDEYYLPQSNIITIDYEEPIYGCTDEAADNYDSSADADDGSCEYPPDEPCEVEVINHYRGHLAEDEPQNAILVAFKITSNNCEDEEILVEIDLFQNGYDANYSTYAIVNGDEDVDISHIFDNVSIGNSWIPRITVLVNEVQKEQVMFWGIDIVEQEPEVCEINLYYIMLETNSTHATIAYDLDCGYQENELEGYNVSVQFLVFEIGSENDTSSQPIVWDTTLGYVQGWEYDNNSLTLTNFTSNNTTHYDFYWYATWTDADGDMKFIERYWLNRELNE